jgi:hypothetical protein
VKGEGRRIGDPQDTGGPNPNRMAPGSVLIHGGASDAERGSVSETLMLIVICGPVGILCLGIYLRDVVHLWRLWRHGIRTRGVVVDHITIDAEAGKRWEPVIAFEDRHGHRVTSKPIIRMDEKMQIGRELPVAYMAHRPETMYVFTRWHLVRPLLSNWLVLVLGSVFLGIAVGVATGLVQVSSA